MPLGDVTTGPDKIPAKKKKEKNKIASDKNDKKKPHLKRKQDLNGWIK